MDGHYNSDEVPDEQVIHLEGALAARIASLQALIDQHSCSILATNELDKAKVSPQELSEDYKGQKYAEQNMPPALWRMPSATSGVCSSKGFTVTLPPYPTLHAACPRERGEAVGLLPQYETDRRRSPSQDESRTGLLRSGG